MPKISIVIPIHDMDNGAFFLWRAINSIMEQTFKDYEIIITREGKMAENTNAGIKKAKGEVVKILYLDDYFATEDVLQMIADNFTDDIYWMIIGCSTNPQPFWTDDIETGNNKLGSPSCLAMRNMGPFMLFDEKLSWLLDVDLYKRLNGKLGKPKIMSGVHINIGVHDGQMTNIMTDDYKLTEHKYVAEKYK